MSTASTAPIRVPLNSVRFALPDFKTIEILYCDKPTGSWATGVRWVFFNGEAIWLEGSATEWFEPQTLEAIRRCYAILHEHRDAFTHELIEAGGVFSLCIIDREDRAIVRKFTKPVEVDLGGRVVRQELTVGGGHASGQLGWLHFGLGDVTTAKLRVQWPQGEWSVWQTVAADSFWIVDREHGVSPWKAP
jgi:hypothetical protein